MTESAHLRRRLDGLGALGADFVHSGLCRALCFKNFRFSTFLISLGVFGCHPFSFLALGVSLLLKLSYAILPCLISYLTIM